ncbi:hypothetical protein K492DRAFT_171818 [Lichtheimia hyalospora FSU 10163]|nr:hypothetical protein K492DRAFT_171818 [Lichtheimia hyalospora FSU 10163]
MDCQHHHTPSLPSIDVMLQDAPSLTPYRRQHDMAHNRPTMGHRRHVSDFVLSTRPKPEEHHHLLPSLSTSTCHISSIQNQHDNPPQFGSSSSSLHRSQETPATRMMQSKLRYAADNNTTGCAAAAAPALPPCTELHNESKRMMRPPYHHGRSMSDMTPVYSSSTTSTASDHKTVNKYFCSYCRKGFSRPSSLRTHTYSHTGEKPFVCTVKGCHRRFNVHSNLRRHLRTHQPHHDTMNTGSSNLAVFAVNAEYCTPAW